MIGEVHRILNDKTVMKEVELFMMTPAGTIKPFMIRVGDMVQVATPKKKDKKAKKKATKKERRL